MGTAREKNLSEMACKSQVGFEPARQSQAFYKASALPPSHHGTIGCQSRYTTLHFQWPYVPICSRSWHCASWLVPIGFGCWKRNSGKNPQRLFSWWQGKCLTISRKFFVQPIWRPKRLCRNHKDSFLVWSRLIPRWVLVVSIGHFHAIHVVFVPLEYM